MPKTTQGEIDVDRLIDSLLAPVLVALRHRVKQILIVAANAEANPADMDRILAEQLSRDRIEISGDRHV